jgi:hypothetical protein
MKREKMKGNKMKRKEMKENEIKIYGKKYKFKENLKEINKILRNTRNLKPRGCAEDKFNYWIEEDLKKIMTKIELKAFYAWIGGQTCPLIEIDGKQYCGYYTWDVDRFFLVRYGNTVMWD